MPFSQLVLSFGPAENGIEAGGTVPVPGAGGSEGGWHLLAPPGPRMPEQLPTRFDVCFRLLSKTEEQNLSRLPGETAFVA